MNSIDGRSKSKRRSFSSDHSMKCIDGKTVGCVKCAGYCRYEEHPGYLTGELMKAHGCREKDCMYFIPKETRERTVSNPFRKVNKNFSLKAEEILKKANKLAKKNEGMCFVGAEMKSPRICELTYATISNGYDLGIIADRITGETGIKIELRRLDLSYEAALEAIYRNK